MQFEGPPKPSLEQTEAQGNEAEKRREEIGVKYGVTEEEIIEERKKFNKVVKNLPENPTPEQVVTALDETFSDDREKNILLDSLSGKISESIKHFLPAEAQKELSDLLKDLSEQPEGKDRKFKSIANIYNELQKYGEVFKKYNIDADSIAQSFINELKEYLKKVSQPK